MTHFMVQENYSLGDIMWWMYTFIVGRHEIQNFFVKELKIIEEGRKHAYEAALQMRVLAEEQLFKVLIRQLDIQCVACCVWLHMLPEHVLA